MSSEGELTDSDEEYKPLKFASHVKPRKRNREETPLIDAFSFVLGALLAAPFMALVCSAEDMLSGSRKATGLVFIAAAAPSCAVKVVFLIFQQLGKVSVVTRCMLMFILIVAGLMCVAMSQTSYDVRYVGVCFASLGMAFGEVYMLSLSTQMLQKTAMVSYMAGTATGGLISTLLYVSMTCWSDVNPRAAMLIPLVWPTLYLLTFAVFHLECMKKYPHRFVMETTNSETKPSKRPTNLCIKQFLGVKKALDVLSLIYVSSVSVFLTLGAIVTTLVFNGDIFAREDYQHYILCSIIGQFFGRCAMALVIAKKADIRTTPFQAVGFFFTILFLFLIFLDSWNRFIVNIWGAFAIVLFQGVASGMTLVSSFHRLTQESHPQHVELLILTASLCETFGMLCAGLIGLHTEPSLFRHCYEINYGNSKYCLARVKNENFWMTGKSG